MTEAASEDAAYFSVDALEEIVAAFPPEVPSKKVALLPELLRTWAAEALKAHLDREGRPAIKKRQQGFVEIGKNARGLLNAINALDAADCFAIAMEAQSWLEAREGSPSPHWAMLGLP